MLSSLSTPPSAEAAEAANADYRLGQTGGTVIYRFPTGDALMNRGAATAPTALVEYQREKVLPAKVDHRRATALSPDDATLIDARLAAGMLTVAQVQVARYDQEVTGMSLVDALTLRGWL